MDLRPLNTHLHLRSQPQEGTTTEPVPLAAGSWPVEAHQSHYQAMSTSTPSQEFDGYMTTQRGRTSTLPHTQPPTGVFHGQVSATQRPPSRRGPSSLTDPALLPPTLTSQPPPVQCSVTQLQYLEVVGHPKFEEILRAIFIGRQIGEDQEKQRLIGDQHKRSMDSIHQARLELQKHPQHSASGNGSTPELDIILSNYLKLVHGLNQELVLTQSEANNACTMFEQQIKAITSNASQMEGPVALSATDEDHLRQVLKRKYSDQIRHLSEEFRRKRKKGKLPLNATDVLRGWWDNNLAWPYPSEDEKRALAQQTDLSATQINNWFINQRKRHWHKFFKDGRLPQSPEEAVEILKQQGVLP